MNAKLADSIRRVLWHIRWIILILLIVFSTWCIFQSVAVRTLLSVQGIGWGLFFLLGHFEGYLECKANCKL